MPRKYPIPKLMRGRGQQNAKKLCKTNKKNIKEQNLMLHIQKLLKLSQSKKVVHQRALKSLNNINESVFNYEMALRFDNLYVEDAKSVNAKDLKIQGLKELNLIHLDLLQQQADEINERDKRIRVLQEENKNLKARLDRIDRRVSLSLTKKLSNIEPLTVDTFTNEEEGHLVDSETQTFSKYSPVKNTTIKSPVKSNTFSDKGNCEDGQHSQKLSPKLADPINLSPLNSSQTLRTSPREKRNKKDLPPNVTLSTGSLIPECSNSIDKKTFLAETKGTFVKKPKLSPGEELTPDAVKKDITDHSLRSRDKQKDSGLREGICESVVCPKILDETSQERVGTPLPLLTVTEPQTSQEEYKNKASDFVSSLKNSILTTNLPYFLASPRQQFVNSLSSPEESSLEIPKWRVKNLFPLYVMEGTENLGEEIILKRHAKPEHDERRRKRWDLQRLREQRQYGKLRQRYDSRHSSPGVRMGSNLSLWPSCDTLLSICVEQELPVCAFGQPLAVIDQDFCVPWLAKSNQLTPKRNTR